MEADRDVLASNGDGATNWIQTYSGKFYQYLKRNAHNIVIEDIAHALSLICRFSGQCREFYSVAQHCCIAHDYADSDIKLETLLHDASEAYISDIPRPIKQIIPEIKELEQFIQVQVASRFKFRWPTMGRIEILDSQLLLAEAQQLFDHPIAWKIEGLDPLDIGPLYCWKPKVAETEFLQRFDKLMEFDHNGQYWRRDRLDR